ncbi:unnamed protein product [Closterium sp. NIES-64]|nr:unnamed protein product [Closterium sp. NIES-64]
MASSETITTTNSMNSTEPEGYGVLLYYQYVDVSDDVAAADWMRRICEEEGLLGRVRVSKQGFNVTVVGRMSALHSHIASLSQHPSNWFATPTSSWSPELVTLCPVDLSLTANHVSAEAFHQLMLQGRVGNGGMENGKVENGEMVNGGVENGGVEGEEESTGECEEEQEEKEEGRVPRGMVVLDTRNVYETRIGRFVPPKGAASRFLVMPMCSGLGIDIHPPLHLASIAQGGSAVSQPRRISDPRGLDFKTCAVRVLHCTGGVRCESATAYLRSKGPGFQDVVQVCAMRCVCYGGACGAGVCYAVHVVKVCAMRCVCYAVHVVQVCAMRCMWCRCVLWAVHVVQVVCYAVHVVQVCAMRCMLVQVVCYAVHVVQVCAMRCMWCRGIVRYLEAFPNGGGIVRYLEAFPDGGFFQGKNFVFDHRLAVPPAAPQQATIGVCCLCVRPFDDYSGRNRCAACRMLLLVCPACTQTETDVLCEICQKGGCSVEGEKAGDKERPQQQYRQRRKDQAQGQEHGQGKEQQEEQQQEQGLGQGQEQGLGRGQEQGAGGSKAADTAAETAAAAVTTAPFPFTCNPGDPSGASSGGTVAAPSPAPSPTSPLASQPPRTKFAWLTGPIDLALQAPSLKAPSLQERSYQAISIPTLPFSPPPPHPTTTTILSPCPSTRLTCFGTPSTSSLAGQLPAGSTSEVPGVTVLPAVADAIPAHTAGPHVLPAAKFPADQLDGQVYGWAASLSYLREVVSELGPFDGVLGFLPSWKEGTVDGEKTEQETEGSENGKCAGSQGAVGERKVWGGIRFAILCSGYLAAREAHPLCMS